jgi:hypothetical protein
MPKRKTADVTPEAPAAAEPRKKASTAKPKAAAAATHKRTATPKMSKVGAEVAAAGQTPRVPTHAEIAALAWSFWEARGFQGGSPEDDWFQAEQQLMQKDYLGSFRTR